MNQLTKDVRYNKWARIIVAANNSGLTKAEFCRRNGINEKTFFYYQSKIRQGLYDQVMQDENTSFVELPVAETPSITTNHVAVIHIGEVMIEITDGISESTLMSIGRMIRNAL